MLTKYLSRHFAAYPEFLVDVRERYLEPLGRLTVRDRLTITYWAIRSIEELVRVPEMNEPTKPPYKNIFVWRVVKLWF